MISRFRRLLRGWLPRRLICRFPLFLADDTSRGLTRELVLVLSPTVPHLRRLTIYRRCATDPGDPLCAA